MARLGAAAVVVALVVAGCGDDDGGAPPPGQQPARPATATGAVPGGPGSKNLLVEKPHIEDRVTCPIPEQPTDPRDGKCDPKAPSCGEHLYCLPLAQGAYCEPCPERDGIRHAFKERDFDPEHNRDPFQSAQQPLGPGPKGPRDLTKTCPRPDQLVASTASYLDLKLVAIVAMGTQRKVLMMGPVPGGSGTLGYMIKRGDCVGKEKAVAKDIGAGYITFQLDPDASGNPHGPDQYEVQLNPKQLSMNDAVLPGPPPRTPSAPVAPPGTKPPPGAPAAPAGAPPIPGAPGARQAAGAPPVAPASGTMVPLVEAPPPAKKP